MSPSSLTNNFPLAAFRYLGGGSGASAVQSAPVPLPAPPVTSTNQAVVQAEQDMARSNLMKKTVQKTMLAGDTGGYTMGQATAGQPSQAATTGYKGKLG